MRSDGRDDGGMVVTKDVTQIATKEWGGSSDWSNKLGRRGDECIEATHGGRWLVVTGGRKMMVVVIEVGVMMEKGWGRGCGRVDYTV